MRTEHVRQGATFEITLTDTDLTAETATLTISNESGVQETDTQPFVEVGGKMAVTLTIDTLALPLGDYDYMYTLTYTDGRVVKLPDVANCDDDSCGLPAFIVCEANDITES